MPELVKVVFDIPVNDSFEYISDSAKAKIGSRVRVSFGNSTRIGVIIDVIALESKLKKYKLKKIDEVIDEVPILTKEIFKTFKEINQLELVRQAGVRQQYIDQSVSLNLAFPAEASPKWINQVHLDAWKKGIKTLYYMRTESVLRGDIAAKAMEECVACDG